MSEQLEPLLQRLERTIVSLRSDIQHEAHARSIYDKPFDKTALIRAQIFSGIVEAIIAVDAPARLANIYEIHCEMFERLTQEEFNAMVLLVHAFVFQDAQSADQSKQCEQGHRPIVEE